LRVVTGLPSPNLKNSELRNIFNIKKTDFKGPPIKKGTSRDQLEALRRYMKIYKIKHIIFFHEKIENKNYFFQ